MRHIVGAGAHAVRARELCGGDVLTELAGPVVTKVLCRYPAAAEHGGRLGELVRAFDVALRGDLPGSASPGS